MMKLHMKRRLGILLAFSVMVASGGYAVSRVEEERVRKEVSAKAVSEDVVIAGGMPIGIYLETNGVLVLGTDKIKGADGTEHDPAGHAVKSGDYITALNGTKINNKSELIQAVESLTEDEAVLSLRRAEENIEVKIKAVECSGQTKKLGIWVRDNTQGLGTVTFMTGEGKFGALGHGIHDTDTNDILQISEGRLYETTIRDIQKGQSGSPGGMEGVIVYSSHHVLGAITSNNDQGIYGTIDKIDALFTDLTPIKTAIKEEIQTGPAKIRCMVDGTVRDYDIEITEVNIHAKEVNKGIVIQVTDPELLQITGGIVQGMSGSPIIQNDKLVGAVTHVFVQDASKGYGIFIENMLENV